MDKTDYSEPLFYNGRHYDAQHKNFAIDIPFYVEQSVKFGDPVLELACGTGRVTIPIAKAGFDITGIDISSSMLNSAAVDAADAGAKVNFVKSDIRSFNLERKFQLIICPFNAIAHLLDLKSVIATFLRVKKHLNKEGKFIFDFFNPSFERLFRDESKRYPVDEYQDPDSNEKVILTESNHYDRATQINYIKWYYKIGEREEVHNLDMRMFFPKELDALLQLNGFRIHDKFGDFDGSEFTENSGRQVMICSVRR